MLEVYLALALMAVGALALFVGPLLLLAGFIAYRRDASRAGRLLRARIFDGGPTLDAGESIEPVTGGRGLIAAGSIWRW